MAEPTETNVKTAIDNNTLTPDNSIAVGELMAIMSSYSEGSLTISAPTGGAGGTWTNHAEGEASRPVTAILWVKLAESGDSGATFTPDGQSGTRDAHTFMSWSGVAGTLAEACTNVTATVKVSESVNEDPTVHAWTDITTTVDDAVGVAFLSGRAASSGGPMGVTWGSGLAHVAGSDARSGGSGAKCGVDVGSKVQASFGAVDGDVTLDMSSGGQDIVQIFFAVQPAAGGPTVITRTAGVDFPVDGIMMEDPRASDRSHDQRDELLLGDDRYGEMLKTIAEQLLVSDTIDAPLQRTVFATDGVITDDPRTSELSHGQADALVLADQRRSDLLKTMLDALAVDDLRTSALEFSLTDALLVSDGRLSVVDKTIIDAVLISDEALRITERLVREGVLLYDSVTNVIQAGGVTIVERTVTDTLLLLSLRLFDWQKAQADSLLLGDGRLQELLRQLRDSVLFGSESLLGRVVGELQTDPVLLSDITTRDRTLTTTDRLLLGASADRIRELLSRDNLLLGSTGARTVFGTVVEALVWALLRHVDPLGVVLAAQPDLLGVTAGEEPNMLIATTGYLRVPDVGS